LCPLLPCGLLLGALPPPNPPPRLQFDAQRAELQSRLHDAWGREELLRAACHSQLAALEDKDSVVAVGGRAGALGMMGHDPSCAVAFAVFEDDVPCVRVCWVARLLLGVPATLLVHAHRGRGVARCKEHSQEGAVVQGHAVCMEGMNAYVTEHAGRFAHMFGPRTHPPCLLLPSPPSLPLFPFHLAIQQI